MYLLTENPRYIVAEDIRRYRHNFEHLDQAFEHLEALMDRFGGEWEIRTTPFTSTYAVVSGQYRHARYEPPLVHWSRPKKPYKNLQAA